MRSERVSDLPKATQQCAQSDPSLGSWLSEFCFFSPIIHGSVRQGALLALRQNFFFFFNCRLRFINEQRSALKKTNREFPGGPVVRTLGFHCRGCGFNAWMGN